MKHRRPNDRGRPLRPRSRDHAASVAPIEPAEGPEALRRFARGLVMTVAERGGVPRARVALAFGLTTAQVGRIVGDFAARAADAGCEVRDG